MMAAANRRWHLSAPRTPAQRTIDLGVLSTLLLLGLVGFQLVYGNPFYLISGVVALVLALVIALLAHQFRWGLLRTGAAVLGVHLLLGSAFAVPDRAFLGILPTFGSLWDLVLATWQAWKSNLTVSPPVGTGEGVLAVVWLPLLVLGTAAFSTVLRTRLVTLAWALTLVFLLLSVVFTTSAPFLGLLRGIAFALISLAWLTWRYESERLASATSTIMSDTVRPGSWQNPVLRRRVIGGAIILVLSLGLTAAAAPLLDPPEGQARFALRDRINPPFDPRRYTSPLSEFRGYFKSRKKTELFTISGVQGGEKIRLATLDQHDAHVYLVAGSQANGSAEDSGAFLKSAEDVDLHEPSEQALRATVSISGYTGVWMPHPGERLDRIDLTGDRARTTAQNLYFNDPAQTLVDASGLRMGDTYEIVYEPYEAPSDQERRELGFADVSLPDNAPVDSEMEKLAQEWTESAETDAETMDALITAVKAEGYYSHGVEESDSASLSGHGKARLMAMLEEPGLDKSEPDAAPTGMIGDEEQYAALVAVMARSLGIPARVVMGFEVPAEQNGGTASIVGENVTAWVEVAYNEVGWVRYDVAPDEEDTPTQPEPNQVQKPRPQVAQPPPPPVEPPSPPPAAVSEDDDEEEELPGELPRYVRWILVGASPFVLIALILGGIVVAKMVRRRRRRWADDPGVRLHGGWDELLDLRHDMRRPVPRSLTRRQAAALLADEADPSSSAAIGRAAQEADRGVFAPQDLTDPELDAYWDGVMEARGAMLAPLGRWRRFRATVSPRSFGRTGRARRSSTRRTARTERELQRRCEGAERGGIAARVRTGLRGLRARIRGGRS